MQYDDAQFLEYVVKAIVDYPDAVRVTRIVDEMGVRLDLDVDSRDMGKVIGRDGKTASAIRTLLRVFGMKNNARVAVKINEPEGGTKSNAGMTGATSTSNATSSVDAAIEELKA
jgi:predicted RNA-binding protein YlqC (UPF0109 family)